MSSVEKRAIVRLLAAGAVAATLAVPSGVHAQAPGSTSYPPSMRSLEGNNTPLTAPAGGGCALRVEHLVVHVVSTGAVVTDSNGHPRTIVGTTQVCSSKRSRPNIVGTFRG